MSIHQSHAPWNTDFLYPCTEMALNTPNDGSGQDGIPNVRKGRMSASDSMAQTWLHSTRYVAWTPKL